MFQSIRASLTVVPSIKSEPVYAHAPVVLDGLLLLLCDFRYAHFLRFITKTLNVRAYFLTHELNREFKKGKPIWGRFFRLEWISLENPAYRWPKASIHRVRECSGENGSYGWIASDKPDTSILKPWFMDIHK